MNAEFVPRGNSEPHELKGPNGQSVPAEPFAYMSRPGGSRPKIRSPRGLLLFGLFLIVAAVAALVLAVAVPASLPNDGAIAAGIFVFAIFGGLGVTAVIMGVKRIRWKREYVRVTGHEPWQ